MTSKTAHWATIALSVGVACGVAAGMGSQRDVVYVPRDYQTIQQAVEYIPPNCTIVVEAGTYVENVVIAGDGHRGTQLQGLPGAVIQSPNDAPAVEVSMTSGVSVSGFGIHSQGVGIHVGQSTGVNVIGVWVDGTVGDAIRIDDSRFVRVESNAVYGTGAAGIRVVDSTGVSVFDNSVDDTASDGVAVSGGVDFAIERNVVSGCGGSGVACDGAGSVTIDENRIDRTDADAVNVVGASVATVSYNTIGNSAPEYRVAGDGVHVESSGQVYVEENTVMFAAGHGVCVLDCGGAAVDANEIRDVGAHGVLLGAGAVNGHVMSNSISRTGEDGVSVEGAGNSVSTNRVTHAGVDGVAIRGPENVVDANVLVAPAHDGVCVLNVGIASGVEVTANKVTKAGHDGIDVGSASNSRIAGNKIDRAKGNGIEISDGSGNVLERNRAAHSRGYDLFEAADPAANTVAKSNKFKRMNRRGRHHH